MTYNDKKGFITGITGQNGSFLAELLGWNPTKTLFPKLMHLMVKHDLDYMKKLQRQQRERGENFPHYYGRKYRK